VSGSIDLKTTTSVNTNIFKIGSTNEPEKLFLDLDNDVFTFNGDEIVTSGNIATFQNTDADTLDGIDSSQFARKDTSNTFGKDISFEKQVSFGDSLFLSENATIYATDSAIEVALLQAGTVTTDRIIADKINSNVADIKDRLTVQNIDVGQWIMDCEAGLNDGCKPATSVGR
jgi:hypothetical protein